MGIELVWKAVVQWPLLLFGWLLGMRALRALRGRARGAASIRAITPFAVSVVPVAVALAVQESIAPSEAFTHFPPGVSYGVLPRAIFVGALVAAPLGLGTGVLGAIAAAVAVPVASLVLLKPPGMQDGVQPLLAAVAAALAAVAARPGEPAISRGRTAASFASWWLLFALASVMVLLSGFAKLAIVLGAVSATSAAMAAAAAVGCAPVLTNGTTACMATAFAACALLGQGYDEAGIPRTAWWLLAFAPAAAIVGRAPALRAHPRTASALQFSLPVLVAIAAIAIALSTTGLPGTAGPGDADAYGLASP